MEQISITSQKEPFSCVCCGGTIKSGESFQAVGRHIECPKKKRLFQMHWQFRDNNGMTTRTELIAQANEDFDLHGGDMKEWSADIQKRHGLPDDAIWMMCNEDSPMFIRQRSESNEERD